MSQATVTELQNAATQAEQAANLLANIFIPPCPRVVAALVQEANKDLPDFEKLDKLLSGDVGLAAAVLKTANSPYYGLQRKVQSVKQSLSVLGLRTVTSIVTLLALRKALPTEMSLDRFWDRTNYHALACGAVARYLKLSSADAAYTFGLFNDCGIPILAMQFPDYKETLTKANHDSRPITVIEQEHYGTNHAIVGAVLASNWQLPEPICKAIREHHSLDMLYTPGAAAPETASLRCVSMVADFLVNRFLEIEQEAEWNMHGPAALSRIGLQPEDLDWIFSDLCDELEDTRRYRTS